MMNIYKEALEVQDAVNLSGVVHTFNKVLDYIWDEAREKELGTDYVNNHPVSILFADKINHLTKMQDWNPSRITGAYRQCIKLSKKGE
ncbi:MAG: hypothetical protein RBR32_10350 [Bacteroidales bacterium]|nr:hypothetical protein [Bacteroidales bacterium]